ncbi:hypothetical protein FDI40_gp041 [Agrobacterium phage Atu_ph07]|uniref:Uncharacterized protein n=1 Tax=Agrobacterium phage Atu_ph07 TaxID=2024264 RepID=A0A2L0UZ95_9CAUD|nr:hypothetical protein FDI40_gp041 [Agrobacterium phage Atu_ph07]AUZ94853.1 hypothetical protein [Agrobacterium phage Atu_ph07]
MNPPPNAVRKLDGNVSNWIMPANKDSFKFTKKEIHLSPDSIFTFTGENKCILTRKGNTFAVKHEGDMFRDGIATFKRPEEAISFIAELNDVSPF